MFKQCCCGKKLAMTSGNVGSVVCCPNCQRMQLLASPREQALPRHEPTALVLQLLGAITILWTGLFAATQFAMALPL